MNCTYCQNELSVGMVYCPKCGKPIQLVPEYNELEEELLIKIVEDKDKDNSTKFIEGVYVNNKTDEVELEELPEEKKDLSWLKKHLKSKFVPLVIIIAVLILLVIILLFENIYMHSYDYYYSQATEAEKEGRYNDAVSYYQLAISADYMQAEAYLNLGKCYYDNGDFSSAVKVLKQLIVLTDSYMEAYQYLVYSYVGLGQYEGIDALVSEAKSKELREFILGLLINPPEFGIDGGIYHEDFDLLLSSDDGYEIFYTIDGSNPVKFGDLYKEPIVLDEGITVVKAVCKNENGEYSRVISQTYGVEYVAPAAPIVSPEDGIYPNPILITFTVPEGCTAYYTWDGTIPNEKSSLSYYQPIAMEIGDNVLTVILVDAHGLISEVTTHHYICGM